jgi:HAD superfamily hydrolase (TIGR01509 family)
LTPPKLVIFDCDGVLVDSEPISNEVLARMLAEEGWEMTVAQARATFQGLLLADIRAVVEHQLGRALPEDWIDRYVVRRTAVFEAELRPVVGAAALVRRVRDAGIPVCIASQGTRGKISRSLALTGLEDLFEDEARFSAYEVPRGKPHPDLFLRAAEAFAVAPADCTVVEDTPSGVVGAVSAGMAVYGFCADSDEQALRDAGAVTSDSLAEIGDRLLGRGTVDSL